MTEKRFELKWRDTGEVLYDNETGLEHGIYSPDYRFHVRDKLNELAEENQRLKNDCSILVQSNQEYRKENEELKKENKKLKGLIDLFAQDICDLTEILSKNQLDYKLHSDVENFIIKWGIRID